MLDTEVRETALRVSSGFETKQQKAVALHNFVRDEILFGWTPSFDNASPRDTLSLGVGHCNPKAKLFSALLTAVDIEARVQVANIGSGVLRGLFSVPPQVTHSWTELRYGPADPWLAVDSYVVDRPMADKARERLKAEGPQSLEGYGVHLLGTSEWNGVTSAFCQANGIGGTPATRLGQPYLSSSGANDVKGAAGGAYMNPPRAALLLIGLLPRFCWDRLFNSRVRALRAAVILAQG